MAESKPTAQTIEDLRKRHEKLNEDKITARTNYDNARKQLEDEKAKARTEYGTDDLDALRAELKKMEAENERKRSEYQAHLDKIDADLKEVDQKFAQGQK